MQGFITIKETRIRSNTIKRYKPVGTHNLNIYYSASKSKIDMEVFTLDSKQERDELVETLDSL